MAKSKQSEKGNVKVKKEIKEEEEDEDETVFGPAAMGLKRVGEEMPAKPPTTPGLALNNRGMPARIRKKNRFFYDDDILTSLSPRSSPKRGPKPSPVKKTPKSAASPAKKAKVYVESEVAVKEEPGEPEEEGKTLGAADRKTGQRTGMRLRNMLKLPKAHKWVCYEWFYSNIDRPLYCGANDFLLCLEESFPTLATRQLRRSEWCLIRRMMGKPRRCSQAFFAEERGELDRKRGKIRLLQQRKMADTASWADLPNEVPLQLVIGSKVTARLRKPQDGLFAGSIDAVDTSDNTYRISFERTGLGTHSVPDYEVLSHEPPETITLASFVNKFRPRPIPPPLEVSDSSLVKAEGDKFVGEYTVELLTWMVRMEKVLERKRTELTLLELLNRQAESFRSQGQPFQDKFQARYAGAVLRLEELNHLVRDKLLNVRTLLQDGSMAPALAGCVSLSPQPFRDRSVVDAEFLMDTVTLTRETRRRPIRSARSRSLMRQLASLLLLVQQMSTNPKHAPCDVKVLQEALDEVRSSLAPNNLRIFQDAVEVHMHHIMFQLNRQLSSKHPFVISLSAN